MTLESDAAWLRKEANRLFDRLNEVAREMRSPGKSEAQKAGYVSLMASDMCKVLREIRQRGLFEELARGVEHDLNVGTVSINHVRSDLENIVTFERGLLTGYQLSEGAADALLTSFRESTLMREWPQFSALIFMENVDRAIQEVCSVPKTGTQLWVQQTYRKARKRYGLVGGAAIAATNLAAVASGLDPTVGSVSKFVGAVITLDGTGPMDGA